MGSPAGRTAPLAIRWKQVRSVAPFGEPGQSWRWGVSSPDAEIRHAPDQPYCPRPPAATRLRDEHAGFSGRTRPTPLTAGQLRRVGLHSSSGPQLQFNHGQTDHGLARRLFDDALQPAPRPGVALLVPHQRGGRLAVGHQASPSRQAAVPSDADAAGGVRQQVAVPLSPSAESARNDDHVGTGPVDDLEADKPRHSRRTSTVLQHQNTRTHQPAQPVPVEPDRRSRKPRRRKKVRADGVERRGHSDRLTSRAEVESTSFAGGRQR